MILKEISQRTAVLYSDWSLQMGQMGPKMTLGTLAMSGDDFAGVLGVLEGSNSVHDLISDIYRRHSDTVYCCVIQRLVTSDGSDGTQNDPGHPEN